MQYAFAIALCLKCLLRQTCVDASTIAVLSVRQVQSLRCVCPFETGQRRAYQFKLRRAEARYSTKYRRQNLTSLEQETDAHVTQACADLLQPVYSAAYKSCQVHLITYD